MNPNKHVPQMDQHKLKQLAQRFNLLECWAVRPPASQDWEAPQATPGFVCCFFQLVQVHLENVLWGAARQPALQ